MKLKILITNDDGFGHQGHQSLKKMLQDLGHEVWSIAPQENQSGVGMKFTLGKSLEFKQLDSHSWACSGTPVDCVLFALHGFLSFRPDAVISGINGGANLSDDLWYSGTAAAAREASRWGLPALALSYDSLPPYSENDFVFFGSLFQQHLRDLLQACELNDEGAGQNLSGFLNINIPPNCNGGVNFANSFALRPYHNVLQKTGEDCYVLNSRIDEQQKYPSYVDTAINKAGHVSISLGAFHSLQPLQLAPELYKEENNFSQNFQLASTKEAVEAMNRIAQVGIGFA